MRLISRYCQSGFSAENAVNLPGRKPEIIQCRLGFPALDPNGAGHNASASFIVGVVDDRLAYNRAKLPSGKTSGIRCNLGS